MKLFFVACGGLVGKLDNLGTVISGCGVCSCQSKLFSLVLAYLALSVMRQIQYDFVAIEYEL